MMRYMSHNLKGFASLLWRISLFCIGLFCFTQTVSATPGGIALNCENIETLVEQGLLTHEEADAFMLHQAYVATVDRIEALVFLPYWSENTISRIRPHVYLPHRPKAKGNKRRTSYVTFGSDVRPFQGLPLAKQPMKLTYKETKRGRYTFMIHADKAEEDAFTNPYARFSLMLHEKIFGKYMPIKHVILGKYSVKVGHGLIMAGTSCNQNEATAFFTRLKHKFLKPCGSKVRNNGLTGGGLQGTYGPNTWVVFASEKDYYASIKGDNQAFSSIPENNDHYQKQLKEQEPSPIHEKLIGGALRRKFSQGHLGLEMLYHGYSLPYGYAPSSKKNAPDSSKTAKEHLHAGCFGMAHAGPHELMGSVALSGNKGFAMAFSDKITFDKKKKRYLAIVAEHYAPYFYNLHGNKKTNEQNFMASIGHSVYGYPIWADLGYHRLIKPSLQTRRQKSNLKGTLQCKTALLPIGFQDHNLTVGQQEYGGGKKPVQATYKLEQHTQHKLFSFRTAFSCSTNPFEKLKAYKGKLEQWIVYQKNNLKITLKAFFTYAYGDKKGAKNRKNPVSGVLRRLWTPVWHLFLGVVYELCAGVRLNLGLTWEWIANKKGVSEAFWTSFNGIKASWELSCDL